MMTWAEGVREVASKEDTKMWSTAMRVVDLISREDWSSRLAAELIDDAKRLQRQRVLDEERAAERLKSTSEEWADWRKARREESEAERAQNKALGLPDKATALDR